MNFLELRFDKSYISDLILFFILCEIVFIFYLRYYYYIIFLYFELYENY